MTQLRKRMQEELQRRNYSESATVCYLRQIPGAFGASRDIGKIFGSD